MISAWTDHLETEEEKKRFRDYVRGSRELLNRLKEILEAQEANFDSIESSPKQFDNPNWDYKQAYRNGQRSAVRAILTLIDLDRGADESTRRNTD
jgi:hypothetical protein